MPGLPTRRVLPTLALLAATTAPLAAQTATAPRPQQANWTLANRFSAAALRPITYTFGVQPRFLGKTDSVYYVWRDAKGTRFMLYVPSPSGGVKRPPMKWPKLPRADSHFVTSPVASGAGPYSMLSRISVTLGIGSLCLLFRI